MDTLKIYLYKFLQVTGMTTIMRNQSAMKRDVFPEEKMKDAVHDVIKNQRSTRNVAKDFGVNRCTLGRYVKDAMRSVDTEDRCYKKSFVTKQVGLGIKYIFRVNTFCVWIFI